MILKHIAVLVGSSSEREVSLMTATGIVAALRARGYRTTQLEIDAQLAKKIGELDIDAAFIASHGKFGEDGTIQGMLDIMGIPYVGSGVLASALAMNKIMSKKVFEFEGLRTPKWVAIQKSESVSTMKLKIDRVFSPEQRLIVKPSSQGSTIGLSLVKDRSTLEEALKKALLFDEEALVEEAIIGSELTVPVLGNQDVIALPCVEIISLNELYDYEAKYAANMSRHMIPPQVGITVAQEAQEIAIRAHKALGCLGISRSDFIADRSGKCWLLEVNTLPGMTNTSLVPDSAKAYGYSYADLVEKLIELALQK